MEGSGSGRTVGGGGDILHSIIRCHIQWKHICQSLQICVCSNLGRFVMHWASKHICYDSSQNNECKAITLALGIYTYFGDMHSVGGLPLITYAPGGRGGGVPIHFHCVLHAKKGGGGRGPDNM